MMQEPHAGVPAEPLCPGDGRGPGPDLPLPILIVDGHALFRAGMRHLLRDLPRPATIFEAATCDEALAVLRTRPIGLVLLELMLPEGSAGRLLVERLRAAADISVPIIVVSEGDDPKQIWDALELGVAGFVPKTSTPEVMLQAVALVLAGGVYVPPAVLRLLRHDPGSVVPRGEGRVLGPPALSERQRAVLAYLAKGWSNKQIAYALGLSEGTVKIHLANLLKVLGARNRTQAIVRASERGLL